jgi:hypothetical protein
MVLNALSLVVDRFVGGKGPDGGAGGGMTGDWTCPNCRANVFASKAGLYWCTRAL